MRQTSDVIKMFSCVGLDCEIRALFFISQPRCFWGSHRSHRFHSFARLVLNLTDASRTLAPLGSHRSHRSHSFARLALNLTEALRTFAPLCLTQIQRDSTKIICVSFGNLSTRSTRSTQSTPTRSTTHLPTSVRFNTIKRKIQ